MIIANGGLPCINFQILFWENKAAGLCMINCIVNFSISFQDEFLFTFFLIWKFYSVLLNSWVRKQNREQLSRIDGYNDFVLVEVVIVNEFL